MQAPNFKGPFTALIIILIFAVFVFVGLFWLISHLFIRKTIQTTQPIAPRIEVRHHHNGTTDTLYMYKE
jgi:predicted RND superfamily exporter protein